MVGRDEELAALCDLLGRDERPEVALVAGEPGVGKTRLVAELGRAAPDATVVLVGTADPGGLSRPFGALLDALGPGATSDGELAALVDPSVALDARLRTAADLVAAAAAGRPTVLALEDLHWADAETVALLGHLAQAGPAPLLLIGTYRPDELSRRHPAADLLVRLDRRAGALHLRLERLEVDDVDRFLAAALDVAPSSQVVAALHRRTGGNPYFLEELLAATPSDDPDAIVGQPLPWSLSEAILRQLDDLEPSPRAVLETASVLGRRVHFDVLLAVTGLGEPDLIGALRQLVAAGALVETEPDVFAFRHELGREAVAGQLLGREHRRLHQAALDALLARDRPDPASVVHHAAAAGRYGIVVDAAREGAASALAAGSPHAALELAERGLAEGDDLALRATAARAAWLAGLLTESRAHAEAWLAGLEAPRAARGAVAGDLGPALEGDAVEGDAGEPGSVAEDDAVEDGVVAAMGLLARLGWELGEAEATDRWLGRLESSLAELDGPARARALALLAQLHMLTERRDGAISWAGQAIELATSLGLEDVRIAARIERASARVRSGPDGEGVRELEEAGDEAAALGLDMLEARAMNNLLWVDLLGPDRATTTRRLDRMRAAAHRIGFQHLSSGYHEARAWIEAADGDLARARALAAEQAAESCWGTIVRSTWFGSLGMGLLAFEDGDLDAAEAFLRRAEDVEDITGIVVHAWCLTAALHAQRKRPAAAAEAVARAADAGPVEVCATDAAYVLYLAGALHRSGIEVRPVLDRLVSRGPAQWPLPAGTPLRTYAEALAALAGGESDRALPGLLAVATSAPAASALTGAGDGAEVGPDAAARRARQVPAAIRGGAALEAARLLLVDRDVEGATRLVGLAEQDLARWGGWRVAELDALRRRLGTGGAVDGAGVLTRREREVVALLTEGLTNGEVAERLFISPRTAGVHVSNVLAKLGMANRAEVAAWAVREGMTG